MFKIVRLFSFVRGNLHFIMKKNMTTIIIDCKKPQLKSEGIGGPLAKYFCFEYIRGLDKGKSFNVNARTYD